MNKPNYPECSGDSSSCPENEGFGCCKPNLVQAKALTDERAEFEKMCVRKGYNTNKWHGDGSIYVDGYTLSGWEAWQARALLASQPSAGTVSELRCDSLCDMHYTRGLEQGFMYGERGDYDGFLKTQKSREGYIATLKETRGESAQADVAAVRDAWLPIETAPEGELVVCMWLDKEDDEHPARYNFDYFEDGIWMNYFSEHEHYAIAGVATGRSEDAPYTHWMSLPAAPTAQPQADGVKP